MSINNQDKYDLVVIGSGPGGYVAAIRAAQLSKRTALVERESVGGVCLNWGCIPTKALLESARMLDEARNSKRFGITCSDPVPDWHAIIKRSRVASTRMTKGVEYLLKKNQIDLLKGSAALLSSNTVEIKSNEDSMAVKADNVILATGARARSIPGLEFDGKRIISYREAMILPEIPKRLLIIGAGAIGIEFAYFFNIMGAEVTLVEMLDRIAPLEDIEVTNLLTRLLSKRGIAIHASSRVTGIKNDVENSLYFNIDGFKKTTEIKVDKCLVAAGVTANIENIGLEKVGIETDRGFVKVDDRMRTNVPGVYAIGDCAGPPMLAHVASHEGILAADAIADLPGQAIDRTNIPSCTYCNPHIASVGLTEAQAVDQGYKFKIGKYLFRTNGRAVAGEEMDGFVKLIVDGDTDRLIGAHIIGPGAPELISEIVLAREHNLTARQIASTIHAHPTFSEAVMEAAADANGESIHI